MTRRAPLALVAAASALALLFVTWFAAFHVGFLERADGRILRGFADLQHPQVVDPIANRIASLCDPKPFIYFAIVPVLIALLRRRPDRALAILAILFGASLTTHLLKPLLAEPRVNSLITGQVDIVPASWPSGHATAAMSLALCTVLAAPARLRPFVAALGAVFAIAVSYSFLALGWHYPSDVLGGFLIAVMWTLLGAAALFALDGRRSRVAEQRPARRLTLRATLGPPVAVVVSGVVIVGLVALARPHAVLTYARGHTTFIVGAAAIGALALVLATGVTLLSGIDVKPRTAAPRHDVPESS